MFDWFNRRIHHVDDETEEYGLQGGSSNAGASMKAVAIFIGPMWVVSIMWSIIPPFLTYFGWPEIFIWSFALLTILTSILGPILGYFIMINAKIAYLAGKDKLHIIFGWSGKDWDKADIATRYDPIPIATTDDLTSTGFLKNVETAVTAIRNEIKGDFDNGNRNRTTN